MAHLSVALFGVFQVELDGEPVTSFESSKVRALLAFLAVEANRAHRRGALAELLWPDRPEGVALKTLRTALANLRQAIGDQQASPPFLLITRDTLQFNTASDHWLDAATLGQQLSDVRLQMADPALRESAIANLQSAISLYRGCFLEGLSVKGSAAFDEWALFKRERFGRQVLSALYDLTAIHMGKGEYEQAQACAQRQLELEPWREEGHRQLMCALALDGQRSTALAQYDTCRQLLEQELAVEPAEETTAVYEQIKAEELDALTFDALLRLELMAEPPSFLAGEGGEVERPVFVARERELARLGRLLKEALEGQGTVAFVTGEAGQGKTTLIREFARRAMDAHQGLLLAAGRCNIYLGVGDPYLPFREVLSMLTGDVASEWAGGTITWTHARRLWAAVGQVIKALIAHGGALLDSFVPGTPLLSRAAAASPGDRQSLGELHALVEHNRESPSELGQQQMFEQYTDVLRAVADEHPLILLLDDMQGTDTASAALLYHLGRRLDGSRILVVAAYRASEVAAARGEELHPLEKVLAEFKSQLGDVWVQLDRAEKAEGRRFMDAFLQTEPNRLGEPFRSALFRHTEGHPLFTVELLRALQERGGLVKDNEGYWIEGSDLQWDVLPARVEGVVEVRIAHLEQEPRETLSVGSVEGEDFTVQVVARVREVAERPLLRELSEELEKRHRLVREQGQARVGQYTLSRYSFAHALFQRYLYDSLGDGERRQLHRHVAQALEELYKGQSDEIAVQLAEHWERAGVAAKAAEYLLQVGDQARMVYAHEEAVNAYLRALAFWNEQGEHGRAARTLMRLGLTYHNVFDYRRASQAYEEGFALWQRVDTPTILLQPAPHALRQQWVDPPSLDPAVATDNVAGLVVSQLFAGLVEMTPELDVVPGVARAWDIVEGGRRYIFHLRDDVRWSDGTPVTAGDFEYAWKRVLDPSGSLTNASPLFDIKGARTFHEGETTNPDQLGVWAEDDHTLVVKLEDPAGYFLSLVAASCTTPVPRHVVEAHGDAWAEPHNIVTNGPFMLERWQRGDSMLLKRNPCFHGRSWGNVERVELAMHPSGATALEAYGADHLDILLFTGLTFEQREWAQRRYAADLVSAPALSCLFLCFDVSQPPFDDVRVRRAFAMAAEGGDYPVTSGLVPPGMPGHSPGIGLPFDSVQARQLLAEAGYPDSRDFPVVDFMHFKPHTAGGDFLISQWRENLGVTVSKTTVEEWTGYQESVQERRPHLFLGGWIADYPDPDTFLRTCLRSWSLWQEDTYDEMLTQAQCSVDQGGRMALYAQADRILMEQAPLLLYPNSRFHVLVKPWVRQYPLSGRQDWFWKDVIIEPH